VTRWNCIADVTRYAFLLAVCLFNFNNSEKNNNYVKLSAARVNCATIERGKIRVHRHEIEIRVLEKGENICWNLLPLHSTSIHSTRFVGEVRLEAVRRIRASTRLVDCQYSSKFLPLEPLQLLHICKWGLYPYPWNHEYETHCNLAAPNYYNKRRKTNGDETYLTNRISKSPTELCTRFLLASHKFPANPNFFPNWISFTFNLQRP